MSDITESNCIHCDLPTEQKVGDIAICDECYLVRGACCTEFEPEEE